MGNVVVLRVGERIDGEKLLAGVKGEMLIAIVSKIVRACAIAHYEELHKGEQATQIAIACFLFITDNLLNGLAWRDRQCFEFYLHQGQTPDEDEHIIALMGAVGIHP